MRKALLGLLGSLTVSAASPALAGGAYCEPDWAPENSDLECASQIVIAPGNDSRINLLLLMQDRAGEDGAGLGYPDLDWERFYGRNFLRWRFFAPAWIKPGSDFGDGLWTGYDGRCQTLESGKAAFLDAMGQIDGLNEDTRSLLAMSRDRLEQICSPGSEGVPQPGEGGYFVNVGANGVSDRPFAYMVYLEGAAAFYAGNWDRAKTYFRIASATDLDPWISETSRYMVARTLLNEAIDSANDDWGWFSAELTDGNLAQQSEMAFRVYLEAYPEGTYAASASGLIRKALWLQQDWARLGPIYADMLAKADPTTPAGIRLIDEVDDKFIMRDADGVAKDPVLLAVNLLMRMRGDRWFYGEREAIDQLSKSDLEAKAEVFADHPDLYAFLRANHAFYVEKDYAAVRELLPDDARQERYTPLAFARQYLRGLAIHALKDPNEEGFWRELIGGAQGAWQRPAVELALARVLEQKGELDEAFAADSPITDPRIRRMLLGMSAGPDLLKRQARAEGTPQGEPAFALFTVLWRQLQHGDYAGFLQDYPLTEAYSLNPEGYGLWGMLDEDQVPVAVFRSGRFVDEYACPSLKKTVQMLSANPRDVRGRLCLGDFYRLNEFDGFGFVQRYEGEPVRDEIGMREFYPGEPTPRHDFYTAIISERGVSAEDRAYALFRAIRCYAPTSNNTCGGEGVEPAVRKQWFQRLKREYASSQWAKELEYYW